MYPHGASVPTITTATQQNPNDDEHLRQGHGEEQTRGARQSRSSRIGFSCRLRPLIVPERFYLVELKGSLVGAVGIEPTTFGLKGRCSTTELRPYVLLTSYIEMT